MKIENGFTIWARQTIESDIFFWKPDKWFKIWFYIVNRVNHKDNKQFKKGSAYIEYKEVCLKTKASYNQVDSFIQWAKRQMMITTQKSIRGNIITVLNYAKYQDWNTYKAEALTEDITEAKPKHNRSITHAINKDDKDVKDEKDIILYKKEIQEIFNIFYEINPTIQFGHRGQRLAAERLISKLGAEKALGSAKAAVAIFGRPYAPTITTPSQLETKLSELVAFYKKNNSSNVITI